MASNGFLLKTLKNGSKFWSKFENNDVSKNQDNEFVNNASLSSLAKWICKKLGDTNLETPFGKEWRVMLVLCIPILNDLRGVYIKNKDLISSSILVDVFFNLVKDDDKWNPVGKFAKDKLEDAGVITLIREMIERIRYWNFVLNTKEHKELSNGFKNIVMSLPENKEETDWKGEPLVKACIEILKLAVLANKKAKVDKETKKAKVDKEVKEGKKSKYGGREKNKDKYLPKKLKRDKEKNALIAVGLKP